MTHIRRSADCGNSPKNGLAEDVAVALETRGVDVLTPILDPEVEWHHPNGVVTSARSVADQQREHDDGGQEQPVVHRRRDGRNGSLGMGRWRGSLHTRRGYRVGDEPRPRAASE